LEHRVATSILKSLASAFLAGEPDFDSLIERAERALGHPYRWLRPIARRYLRNFSAGVRPRQREVVAFLRADPSLARVRSKLTVHDWLTEPQLMRPVPAAVQWDLPAIEYAGALAEWLRLTPTELDWFADLKGLASHTQLSHYHYRTLPKTNGTERIIEAPKPRLKAIQALILTEILDKIPAHPAAHGFRKGRSILTYVAPHSAQPTVLKMDLQDFFPGISGARIQTLFRTAGYPESVADLLGGLCTNAIPGSTSLYRRPHLPQGAPTSPSLANLCAYRLDCRLDGLAQSIGANYTRYADDLAFSGDANFERFLLHVAAIATEEGFTVNHRKTRLMRQGVRQHVAGLVTNTKPNIMRPDYDRLKATLTNCVKLGPSTQNRDNHPHFKQHLEGRVAFVESINPVKGQRLRAILDQIKWSGLQPAPFAD
jgi:RNA-directed DNA polymerase